MAGHATVVDRAEAAAAARNAEGKALVVAVGSFMKRRIRDWVPVMTAAADPPTASRP